MFYILMVTSSNVGSYLVVDSNEQVCMKAALHDLAAKQLTAFKAGRCLLLATHGQPGQGKVFGYQTTYS